MTIDEWNAHGEGNQETDVPIDEEQRELGKKEDNCIIDGRLSWYFIPHSFKVFLDVDGKEGARRIFEHAKSGARKDEHTYTSAEEVAAWARARTASDNRRYQKYYGVTWDAPTIPQLKGSQDAGVPPSIEEWSVAQHSDPELVPILRWLEHSELPADGKLARAVLRSMCSTIWRISAVPRGRACRRGAVPMMRRRPRRTCRTPSVRIGSSSPRRRWV